MVVNIASPRYNSNHVVRLCKNRSRGYVFDTPRWLQVKVYRRSRVHCMYLCKNLVHTYMQNIYSRAETLSLLPYDRMLKHVDFTKRLEASTKDLQSCKCQFQIVLFRLNTALNLLNQSFCKKFKKKKNLYHYNAIRTLVV